MTTTEFTWQQRLEVVMTLVLASMFGSLLAFAIVWGTQSDSPEAHKPKGDREEQLVTRWFEAHVRTCPDCNHESYEGGPAAICPRGLELFKKATEL